MNHKNLAIILTFYYRIHHYSLYINILIMPYVHTNVIMLLCCSAPYSTYIHIGQTNFRIVPEMSPFYFILVCNYTCTGQAICFFAAGGRPYETWTTADMSLSLASPSLSPPSARWPAWNSSFPKCVAFCRDRKAMWSHIMYSNPLVCRPPEFGSGRPQVISHKLTSFYEIMMVWTQSWDQQPLKMLSYMQIFRK